MRTLYFFCLLLVRASLAFADSAPSVPASTASSAPETCECLAASCNPCEVETGTSFYSAKCGKDLAQVKSCKKVRCEPVENQKQCLALLKMPAGAPVVAESKSGKSEGGVEGDGPARNAQSGTNKANTVSHAGPEAGQITDVSGDVKVTHAGGVNESPRKLDLAYVGDTYQTGTDGRLKVLLRDGSEMILAANSKLNLEKVEVDVAALKRQIAMRILAGKVRNRVQKEYKGHVRH